MAYLGNKKNIRLVISIPGSTVTACIIYSDQHQGMTIAASICLTKRFWIFVVFLPFFGYFDRTYKIALSTLCGKKST